MPLRLFLGVTFTFAGLQKLANPGFFQATNPASIQAQLAAAARRSPIHGVAHALGHVAVPVGIVIALAELAVGLGVLLGVLTRVAAAGGAALSFGLFLTVSYHSSPYYTGSDIVFFFAWMPFVVAGAGGVLTLEGAFAVAQRRSEERSTRGSHRQTRSASPGRAGPGRSGPVLDRRTLTARGLAVAAVGGLGVVLAGLVSGLGRAFAAGTSGGTGPSLTLGSGTGSTPTTSIGGTPTTGATAPTAATTRASTAPTPKGTKLGPSSAVPVGGAAEFTDPATGDPAYAVQPVAGTFRAFDAVCPHAGCTVQFSKSSEQFVCPCHGSVFNGRTGALEQGPATTGLTSITIAEGPDGDLYAV